VTDSALAGRVEAALAELDRPARVALEARERGGEDYASIAERLGVGREGVADLLVAARLSVRSHVHAGPEPPRRSPQCGPARRVMAAQHDGEAVGRGDLERLREHLEGCAPCRDARLALREAELACRAWRTAPAGTASSPPPVPARPRSPAAAGRRRLVAAIAGAVVLLILLAVILGGGGDGNSGAPAAPTPQAGSADAPGRDVVTPPGDTFCSTEEPDCP
jgi:hypothetical protein